jgi:hypothetical protein
MRLLDLLFPERRNTAAVARSGETSLLEINVELDGAVIKPVKNGPARPAPFPIVVPRPDPGSDPPWVKPG